MSAFVEKMSDSLLRPVKSGNRHPSSNAERLRTDMHLGQVARGFVWIAANRRCSKPRGLTGHRRGCEDAGARRVGST